MGNRYPPILFADDNLSPLNLGQVGKIKPILDLYEQYHTVSGLNVNPRKSTALCINTPDNIQAELRELGLSTPQAIRHLGIYLGTTIEQTVQEMIQQTDAKLIKRRSHHSPNRHVA